LLCLVSHQTCSPTWAVNFWWTTSQNWTSVCSIRTWNWVSTKTAIGLLCSMQWCAECLTQVLVTNTLILCMGDITNLTFSAKREFVQFMQNNCYIQKLM
jgi:hypothetical protein